MSPGLSAGFIGVVGMAMHDVHIPFEPFTVLPLLVALDAAAVLRWRRSPPAPGSAGAPWWVPIPALIGGLVGASVFFWALHGQVLPPDWDTATHGGLANTIARTHDVLPLIRIPIEGTEFVRVRPGFEATAAVVSWLGAPSPAMAMGPVITVTLLLIPLSLSLLALEATGSVALAAVVPFFALGLAFPSFQAIVGRFPEIVNSTLIVPFVVAALRVFRGVFTRDTAWLLFAITASIWVIHGLEVFTGAVVALGLLTITVVQVVRANPRVALIRMGIAAGAVLGGAVLVTLLTRSPHVPRPTATQPSSAAISVTSAPIHLHVILASIAQTDLISPIVFALYLIGVLALIVQRRMLWVLAAQVLLVAFMVDAFYWHKLAKLWRLIFPWAEQDRILGYQYWLIPLVLGAGFLAIISVMRSLSRTRQLQIGATVAGVLVAGIAFLVRHSLGRLWTYLIGQYSVYTYPLGLYDPLTALRPWIPAMLITVAAVLVAWVLFVARAEIPASVSARFRAGTHRLETGVLALGVVGVVCLVAGASYELGVYRHAVDTRSLVTPADVTVFKTLTDDYPSTTVVMTNSGNDAGMWLAGLTDLTPMVPNGFESGALTLPLDITVSKACTDPAAAAAAIQHEAELTGATILFMGAQTIPSPMNPWRVELHRQAAESTVDHVSTMARVDGGGIRDHVGVRCRAAVNSATRRSRQAPVESAPAYVPKLQITPSGSRAAKPREPYSSLRISRVMTAPLEIARSYSASGSVTTT